jgi:hypothetical protein
MAGNSLAGYAHPGEAVGTIVIRAAMSLSSGIGRYVESKRILFMTLSSLRPPRNCGCDEGLTCGRGDLLFAGV